MARRVLCVLFVVVLFTTAWGPPLQGGDNPTVNRRLHFPILMNKYASGPEPLVDLAWQWGDINLAPGSTGIKVLDWDHDGTNDILVAHQDMILAVRHAGDYRFEQFWAIQNSRAWGVADFLPGSNDEVWVIDATGRLNIYQPFNFEPSSRRRVPLPNGAEVVRAITSDLFGNGQMDLLVLTRTGSEFRLLAYAIPSLNQVWQYTLDVVSGAYDVPLLIAGQVDTDPASEVILSYGAVIDPVRSTEQWFYNEGFGIAIQAANIDGDSAEELISLQGWNQVTAFDIDLQTPKWQFDSGSDQDALLVADVTGNSFPEILVGEGQWGSVKVFDSQTQGLLWSVQNPEHGVSGIGVGDADNDGELDLIWGSGWTSSGADQLYLTPMSRRQPTYTFDDYDGPFVTVPLQLDGDDALELIVFTGGTDSGYGPATHFVLDSSTGAEEPNLHLDITTAPGSYGASWRPLLANVDTDPAQELVLGVGDDLYLFDHDGTRRVKRSFSAALKPKWVGDVDGDGQLELVAHSDNRVTVHAIETLEYEWQSITHTPGVSDLAVGDVDRDGHMEIVFHGAQSSVKAYDGQTHVLDWQMPASQQASGIEVGNADGTGNLEIIVVESGTLMFYDGPTRNLILRGASVGGSSYSQWDVALVTMTYLPHPQLIVAGGEKTLLFRRPFDGTPTQALVGSGTTVNTIDIDGDHHLDLLLGHGLGVSRYRTREPFPDVVPPFARPVTPAPGATLVGRNAFAVARFSEAMSAASIVAANVQLRAGATVLPSDVSYDAANRLLRLNPQGLLPANTDITVWLGPGLVDEAGNGLDGNFNGVGGEPGDAIAWQFRTGAGIDQSGPVIRNLTLTPNPAWAGMPVSMTADADDTNPQAASTVMGAEYFLDTGGAAGTGTPLRAADGLFDERQEQITVSLDTTGWTNDRTVFVHALDSVGNWGQFSQLILDIQPEAAANWPTYGQNPGHTGYNQNQARAMGFSLAWEKDLFSLLGTTGGQLGQVAVANGVVAANVSSNLGGVVALDATNGGERWRRPFTGKYSINPPTIAYGTVYFQQGNHSSDSFLFALNALTGQESWHSPFSAQWESYYAPSVGEGKVFVNGGSYGGMYGYDAFDGAQLWFAGLPQYDDWTPAYSEGVVYSWVAGVLTACDPDYGTVVWSLDLGWNWSGWSMDRVAAVANGVAYVINNGNSSLELVAIDLTSHTEKWRVSGAFTVSPAVADNTVYALDGNTLRAYDSANGASQWSYTAGNTLTGAPVVSSANVYISSGTQTWVLDRATHAVVWQVDKGGWLTVANNQLFIAQSDGKLAAFNIVSD